MPLFLTALSAILLTAFSVPGCADDEQRAKELVRHATEAHDQALKEKDPARKKELLVRAEDCLQEAVNLDPEDARTQDLLVRLLWDEGKQLEAVRLSEALERSHPGDPAVWKLRAEIHSRLKQWDKAVQAYRRAVEAGADEKALIVAIGVCQGRNKDFEDAFDTFDRALTLGVDRGLVSYNMGLCYEGSGNPDLALQSYREACDHLEGDGGTKPRNIPVLVKALLRLAHLYREGTPNESVDPEKALSFARRAFDLAPKDLKVFAELADTLFALGDYDGLKKTLDEAMKKMPDRTELLQYKQKLEEYEAKRKSAKEKKAREER